MAQLDMKKIELKKEADMAPPSQLKTSIKRQQRQFRSGKIVDSGQASIVKSTTPQKAGQVKWAPKQVRGK